MGFFGRMKDAFSNVTEDVEPEYEFEEQNPLAKLTNSDEPGATEFVQASDEDSVTDPSDEFLVTEGALIFPEITLPSEVTGNEDVTEEVPGVDDTELERSDNSQLELADEALGNESDGGNGSFESSDLAELSVSGGYDEDILPREGSFDGLDVGDTVSDLGFDDEVQDTVGVPSDAFASSDVSVEPVEDSSLGFDDAEDGEESEAGESVSTRKGGSSLLWSGESRASEAENDGPFVALEPSLIDLDSHYLGDYRSESLRPASVVQGGVSVVSPVVAYEDGVVDNLVEGEADSVVRDDEVIDVQEGGVSGPQRDEVVEGVMDESQFTQDPDTIVVENDVDAGSSVQEGVEDSPVTSRKWSPK